MNAWGPKTGEFFATAPLPVNPGDETPALAGDSNSARAFVWNQSTISSVTASGVTPLVTDAQPPPSVSLLLPRRLMAYASAARTLFAVRTNAGVVELASLTDGGAPIRSTPITGSPVGLAVTSDGAAAFVAPIVEPALVTGTTVTLNWNTVRNSTNYRVEASTGSGAPILTTLTGNHTSLTVTNVPPGTYTVRVRGSNDSGLGVPSAPITVTVP